MCCCSLEEGEMVSGQLLGRIRIWTALWRYVTGSVGTKEWGEHASRQHWREQKPRSQTMQIGLGQEQHWPDVKLGCNGVFGWKGRNNDWFLFLITQGERVPRPLCQDKMWILNLLPSYWNWHSYILYMTHASRNDRINWLEWIPLDLDCPNNTKTVISE